MNKKWEYKVSDNNLSKEISKKHNISEVLADILVNRNIIEDEKIRIFLKIICMKIREIFLNFICKN